MARRSGGTTLTVRNPLMGFALTIVGALGLSFFIGIPVLFLPDPELLLFYFPFVLFGVGFFAGRTSWLGSVGFVGGLLGAVVGLYLFQSLLLPAGWPLWPDEWDFLLTLGFAAACGLGGLVSGKLGARRIDRLNERAPKMRRCHKCGAKVGTSARKCWSCRAYLPPT